VLVSSFNLKRHIRTNHSDDKFIYKCDYEGCTKSFTEAQNLKDHKNYHLGVKPYICEFCSKGFERVKSLRRHKVRHTDPQHYKCETCSECFVTRTSLSNHVQRQHRDVGNDSKPFACDFEGCNSTFKYKNYLQHHIRVNLTRKFCVLSRTRSSKRSRKLLEKAKSVTNIWCIFKDVSWLF
jgi:KRAB domain-containing zinc finger protein